MSKIICDVCGTSYPETATQCPICGCVRPADVVTVNNDSSSNDAQNKGSYTYVKGGRFSKTNVKKRNSASSNPQSEDDRLADEPQEEKAKGDKGLIIAVCVLLLAIVAVVIYIAIHFFEPSQPQGNEGAENNTVNTTVSDTVNGTEDDVEPTEDETEVFLPCEDILLSSTVIELDKAGEAYLLSYNTVPDLTIEPVSFTSSDETVVTVDENGKITAIGAGQTVITIRCGEVQKECRVVCTFEGQATEPTDETTAPTVDTETDNTQSTDVVLKLNYYVTYTLPDGTVIGDVTLTVGEPWTVYYDSKNEIPSSKVTFTSSDPSVITVDARGVATVVGKGQAMITAEYQGQKVKCRVIVR